MTSLRRGRVLIVDDDALLARMLTRALQERFDVLMQTSASCALSLVLAGHRFDAIVSDVWMPGVSGLDFHAALQRSVPQQADRMVFVTGGGLPSRLREFAHRMDALIKPFPFSALHEAVSRRATQVV